MDDKIFNDDDIITIGLKNCNTDMFDYLYNKYYHSLNRFTFHIVMCEQSHDIVQEVFTKLWINRSSLPKNLNIRSYLYSAVKNSSFNYLKHMNVVDAKRAKIIESILFINDHNEDDDLDFDRVMELIETLPTQQKNVVKLKFEGKSYKEIAAKLNISPKTVNNHIVKAYSFIREIMLLIFISLLYRS